MEIRCASASSFNSPRRKDQRYNGKSLVCFSFFITRSPSRGNGDRTFCKKRQNTRWQRKGGTRGRRKKARQKAEGKERKEGRGKRQGLRRQKQSPGRQGKQGQRKKSALGKGTPKSEEGQEHSHTAKRGGGTA
eukprot:1161731-Pelagomonas_calceolata.AAC.2